MLLGFSTDTHCLPLRLATVTEHDINRLKANAPTAISWGSGAQLVEGNAAARRLWKTKITVIYGRVLWIACGLNWTAHICVTPHTKTYGSNRLKGMPLFDWFKKKTQILPEADELTVRVYMNPLHAMLYAAEKQKGGRLTEEEVLHVRDTTVSMVMPASQSKKFYASLDAQVNVYRMNPDRIWEEWQEIRDLVRG